MTSESKVTEALLADHRRVVEILDQLDAFLERDIAPVNAAFAQLRWTLLREFSRHHAMEKAALLRVPGAYSAFAHDQGLALAVNDHMTQWTATAIHQGWIRYRVAARSLLRRMRRQMRYEETTLFPLLR